MLKDGKLNPSFILSDFVLSLSYDPRFNYQKNKPIFR